MGIRLLATAIALALTAPAWSHGGGLDKCGGHNDRKNGGYHLHNYESFCACHPTDAQCGGARDEKTSTVYVTKTGKKYHRDGCGHLANSRIPMSLADAAKTYGPCSDCKPPIAATPSVPKPPPSTGQCAAITKKGAQCSRAAATGSAYCWQHGGK